MMKVNGLAVPTQPQSKLHQPDAGNEQWLALKFILG